MKVKGNDSNAAQRSVTENQVNDGVAEGTSALRAISFGMRRAVATRKGPQRLFVPVSNMVNGVLEPDGVPHAGDFARALRLLLRSIRRVGL